MASPEEPVSRPTAPGGILGRPAQVLLISGGMFVFISSWRTAAVVLCDLGSTAFYLGGLVERAIGSAAPLFIFAVLLFSYAVRSVYLESCALFVRAGIYRTVREGLGRSLGCLGYVTLVFDDLLTGPVCGVAAGHYLAGWFLDLLTAIDPFWYIEDGVNRDALRRGIAVLVACGLTLFFFQRQLVGRRPTDRWAPRIVLATTFAGVVLLLLGGLTLLVKKSPTLVPLTFNLSAPGGQSWWIDPLGFLTPLLSESVLTSLRQPASWLSLVGFVGLALAFGHSILAMSGQETFSRVYREVESPKLQTFKKASLIVFVWTLVFTGLLSFLAGRLIPDGERLPEYGDHLLSGMAWYLWAPLPLQVILSTLVVAAGIWILSRVVNMAMNRCLELLQRGAEDGLLPDWCQQTHPRFGTRYLLLCPILAMQLLAILLSQGRLQPLAQCYALGVVWSLVFHVLAVLVLRFKDPQPRAYRVPVNLRLGSVELPLGLSLILLVLVLAALANLLTMPVATLAGGLFTLGFLGVIGLTAYKTATQKTRPEPAVPARALAGAASSGDQPFCLQPANEVTADVLDLPRLYRKLVAIRSPFNLFMLERALAEADPDTTGVVVMTARITIPVETGSSSQDLDLQDCQLMSAVLGVAERAGKQVRPLIVRTNNPLFAVLQTARDLQAHELIVGASNKYTADEQLEQIAFYWINLHKGQPAPLTVRVLSPDRDIYLDLGGGNRIPKQGERHARTSDQLRAAGVGVKRLLFLHDRSPAASDLFQTVLTLLDSKVTLAVGILAARGPNEIGDPTFILQDRERARQLGRDLPIHEDLEPPAIVRLAREERFDLIVLPLAPDQAAAPQGLLDDRAGYLLRHAHCPIFLATLPIIPDEVIDNSPSHY